MMPYKSGETVREGDLLGGPHKAANSSSLSERPKMIFRPAADLATELTERWHDQTLDLKGLKFDESRQECVFTITEPNPQGSASGTLFLQKKPLQYCRVTIRNVTRLQTIKTEGEVELYMDKVEAGQGNICLKCANGTLELLGTDLEIGFDILPATEIEVTLTTPVGEVSWRRKQNRGRRTRRPLA